MKAFKSRSLRSTWVGIQNNRYFFLSRGSSHATHATHANQAIHATRTIHAIQVIHVTYATRAIHAIHTREAWNRNKNANAPDDKIWGL